MQYRIALVPFVLLISLILVAGCTILSPPPEPTPVPTPVPTITIPTTVITTALPTATPTASNKPEPTQTMPASWPLSISVEKAGTYSKTLITHIDGGKGMIGVLKITSRVTQPDGTVTERSIDRPKTGDVIEIEGSAGADRIEVLVLTTSGETYKVIDQQVLYKSRN